MLGGCDGKEQWRGASVAPSLRPVRIWMQSRQKLAYVAIFADPLVRTPALGHGIDNHAVPMDRFACTGSIGWDVLARPSIDKNCVKNFRIVLHGHGFLSPTRANAGLGPAFLFRLTVRGPTDRGEFALTESAQRSETDSAQILGVDGSTMAP